MNKLSIIASSLTIAAAILLPASTFAQTVNVSGGVSVSATPVTAGIVSTTTKRGSLSLATIISRADEEIQRRITNLTSLSTRIGQMKNVSASEKTSLQGSISSQISSLTSLKATIDAETVLANLKTDVQSITKSYRTYMLVLPQGRIAAASDRIQTIVADMQALEPKLQARITAAQTAGKSVSGSQSAYTDMVAKVSDASTQSSAALSETANLTPDQGNTTIEASNNAAIKDAAAKIKTATQDLIAARADIATILKAVKGTSSASVTASTSASASVQ
jgi:flagellar biosynthesis/type III secretory pathway chaperone